MTKVRITPQMINKAAAVLDPLAMSESDYVIGCGSGWHHEAHSSHSTCYCGSGENNGKEFLEEKKMQDRARARKLAKHILEAALNG